MQRGESSAKKQNSSFFFFTKKCSMFTQKGYDEISTDINISTGLVIGAELCLAVCPSTFTKHIKAITTQAI